MEGGKTLSVRAGGAATLSQNGYVMAILGYCAPRRCEHSSSPPGASSALRSRVARDRRGRGETGGKTRTGGRETEPCAHGGSGYPRTQTSQLWSSQTVHSRDLAKRCSCAGNSFHLGSVNFRALYVVAKFNLSTPRRPPRSDKGPTVYVHLCC